MTRFFTYAAKALFTLPTYSDIALGDQTDEQLRRSGQSKAGILHRTFSGLHYA